jgi:hypothetical protein
MFHAAKHSGAAAQDVQLKPSYFNAASESGPCLHGADQITRLLARICGSMPPRLRTHFEFPKLDSH